MKFVDSGFEIITQDTGLDGLYKHVERVARVSYKSEDKITDNSAKKMVDLLIKNKHLACLEHGTIYLHRKPEPFNAKRFMDFINKYSVNKYSQCQCVSSNGEGFTSISDCYVTTNARVIIENNWEDDLQYMCEPTEFHEKRYTVKFTWPIGIVRDALRHRTGWSFMNESTRYINYAKEKFGGLTIVIPQWIYTLRNELGNSLSEDKEWLTTLSGEELVNQLTCENRTVATWVNAMERSEKDYFYLTSGVDGYKLRPEQARGILPLDTKSELIMTGFASNWVHFFNMRSYIAMTGPAHEDMQYIVNQVLDEFLKRGYIRHGQLYKKDL